MGIKAKEKILQAKRTKNFFTDFSLNMWCVLGNHGLRWNWSILILVQNGQVLTITSRISQPRSLELIQDLRNCLLNLVFQKMSFFTFHIFRSIEKLTPPPRHGSVKLSSTDYNELNKPNQKSLAYIRSKKSLFKFGVLKNKFFYFFHIFHSKFNFSS